MAEERVEHRLTAILAADVAGYSRLMSVSEEGTLAELKRHRCELFDPKIQEHHGRIVKTTGDGMLVKFASVVDAVRCAVDIQRRMAERNADVPPGRRIELRIGLNVGDIIIDNTDMYGDDVNIAVCLETLAEPGGICASSIVHDQVRDKLGLSFGDMGEQQVKNITRPVRALRILLGALGAKAAENRAAAVVTSPVRRLLRPRPQKPTIAVLPFANISDDADQEYFSQGLAEDIITNLSRNRALFVTSRRTAFAYKGPATDISRVAGELDVYYLLEGSIRCSGNRVRVTAQLLEAETGDHLWAERYDRELADMFDSQDEISQSISGAIVPAIISAEIRQAQRRDASQLEPGPISCGRIATSASSLRVP